LLLNPTLRGSGVRARSFFVSLRPFVVLWESVPTVTVPPSPVSICPSCQVEMCETCEDDAAFEEWFERMEAEAEAAEDDGDF
jgi:hypothetical protein